MVRGILIVLGIAALVAAGVFAAGAIAPDPVEQPIAFPHDVHAGENRIPCMYCHSSADKSVDAGIPAVEVCAGCHLPGGVPMVAADSPGIKVLAAYWESEARIPWVRIHDLPDHAHFPHYIHVNAEALECQDCHGQVQTMAEVEPQQDLEMGWCLECHREREARTDCFICHY